ncbi:flagellar basal body rod protein FlgC [Proteiniborus sp. MB09-C3]|uniref:flagellar basal body rod protein FlgC n=1 Tax=Proteiniborus sp. MB09-C3 TaxID=3050072 RepID=UPI0025529DA7|nr:flagellar basal body rod protein FlgC [Proteiniborus sp. MB09-C3]WIV10853.1 flagellar basal body rod protein FlgC [Proteiniborus sp. MB09-C3]
MKMFNSIDISATGMTAERTRMEIISKNIANASVTRTSSGMPYRRQMVVFKQNEASPFSAYLSEFSNELQKAKGVKVSEIVEDKTPFKQIYEPGHPDADNNGYVQMPNVDITTEMVDMISATRAYEANMSAINSAKNMALKALEIGR